MRQLTVDCFRNKKSVRFWVYSCSIRPPSEIRRCLVFERCIRFCNNHKRIQVMSKVLKRFQETLAFKKILVIGCCYVVICSKKKGYWPMFYLLNITEKYDNFVYAIKYNFHFPSEFDMFENYYYIIFFNLSIDVITWGTCVNTLISKSVSYSTFSFLFLKVSLFDRKIPSIDYLKK